MTVDEANQIRALACSKETDGAGDLVRAVEDDSALLPPAAIDITPTEDMLRAALAALSDSQGRNVREQYLLLRQVQRGCSKAESLVEGLIIDLDRLFGNPAGSD